MKKKTLNIIEIVMFICIMDFVYCTDEEYAITVEDYHHELETRLKIYKKYEEDITAHEYTLFSVTGSDIGLYEAINLFGALYGNPVYKDKVTVFTIRKSQTWDSRDADEYFNKFVSAVRNCDDCIYNFELMKRLGISVDFIDQKYIEGYSAMYKNADQIIERHKKLEKIMVLELENILLEAFTLCFVEQIRPVLISYLVFRRQLEAEDVDFTGFLGTELDNMSSAMIGLSDDQILKNVLCMRTVSKNGSYMAIRHKILEYERNTMFKHFTNNAPAILNFANNLREHKYREVFCQGVRDLVARNVPQIMCQKAKCIIVGILKNRCKEIYDTVKDDRVKYDALLENQDLQMNKIFCESKLLEDCENFIDGLHLKNEKELYTQEIAVIIQKLVTEVYSERISRVLFLDELTDENKYNLCRILRDTKILENLQNNQIILIDGYKSIPHEHLHFTGEQYGMIKADLSINAQTIEVITKSKSINGGDVAFQEYQVKSFRRDLTLGDDSGSLIKVVDSQETNIASICTSSRMINGHDDEMIRMMGFFKDKMLSFDHNLMHTIFYISVNIRDCLTLISIVHHKFSDNGLKEGYSIFYNLPCQYGIKDSARGQTQQRQVKWFGCVPVSFITDLYSYLYFLLHCTPVEFTIPHQLLPEKRMTILYTAKTLECYFFDNFAYHVRNNIANLYGYVHLPCSLVSITEKDILDFEQTKTYSRNENVTKFVKSLGISESDFNRIAYAFIISKNDIMHHFETHLCASERTSPYETICFYTFDTESSVVLNICEVVVGSYKDKLIDSTKLLTRMLGLSERLNVAKEYAYFAKCEDSKIFLIVSVVHELSNFMHYDAKENCLEDAIILNQFKIIFKRCFLTYYEEHVDHDDFIEAKRRRTPKNRRLRVSNIEKLMDDEKIKNFVETLKTEFIALQTKKVMKVTSIKIDKRNGQIMHDDTCDLGLICNIEQYDNLEYLVNQTC